MPYIIDTLEQTEYWYGQGGFPYRVEDMELSHQINVLAHLLRSVDTLYQQKVWRDVKLRGENPDHLIGQDPVQWLIEMPLFRELRQRIKRAGAIPPDMKTIEQEIAEKRHGKRGSEEERPVRQVLQIGPGAEGNSA